MSNQPFSGSNLPKNLSPRLEPDRKSTPGLKPGGVQAVHCSRSKAGKCNCAASCGAIWWHPPTNPTDTFTLCCCHSGTAAPPERTHSSKINIRVLNGYVRRWRPMRSSKSIAEPSFEPGFTFSLERLVKKKQTAVI